MQWLVFSGHRYDPPQHERFAGEPNKRWRLDFLLLKAKGTAAKAAKNTKEPPREGRTEKQGEGQRRKPEGGIVLLESFEK